MLIVSYQAPHTLGRRLADKDAQVKIYGEVYERRAEVETIEGFSAHAGQPLLLEYAPGDTGEREAGVPGARGAGAGGDFDGEDEGEGNGGGEVPGDE